jgi:hypothetical protein
LHTLGCNGYLLQPASRALKLAFVSSVCEQIRTAVLNNCVLAVPKHAKEDKVCVLHFNSILARSPSWDSRFIFSCLSYRSMTGRETIWALLAILGWSLEWCLKGMFPDKDSRASEQNPFWWGPIATTRCAPSREHAPSYTPTIPLGRRTHTTPIEEASWGVVGRNCFA